MANHASLTAFEHTDRMKVFKRRHPLLEHRGPVV